jgi:hypothetical protein
MTVTFAYLGDGLTEESSLADPAWLTSARTHLEQLGTGIVDQDFSPTPSAQCQGCDFLQFCSVGQAFVNQ